MIQERSYTIAAGQEKVVQGIGTFIGILYVSNTAQELEVKGVNEGGQQILSARLLQGERVILDRSYNQLRIKNPGAVSVDVDLLVGTGRFESGRLTGDISVSSVPQAGALTALPVHQVNAIPVVHTIAADTNRRFLMLKAAPDNAGIIWLGGTSGSGVPIYAGETIVIQGTGAVSVIGDTDNDKIYSVSQEA